MSDDLDEPEFTAEDAQHALRNADRARMLRGEFQPGDVEKLARFCRISLDEMADGLGVPRDAAWMEQRIPHSPVLGPLRQLLRVAARSPGLFRWLVTSGGDPVTKP